MATDLNITSVDPETGDPDGSDELVGVNGAIPGVGDSPWLYQGGALTTEGPVALDDLDTDRLLNNPTDAGYLSRDSADDNGPGLESLVEDVEADSALEGAIVSGGTYNLDSQVAPSTSGGRVVLFATGEAVLDASSVSADPLVDFDAAANVELRGQWRIVGSTGSGFQWSLHPGDGFRADQLRLDTGQGGFDVAGTSDVKVGEVQAANHRDTNNGYVAGVHVAASTDVYIGRVFVSDSDRGIEIDDNNSSGSAVRRVQIPVTHVRNIDNSQASSSGSQFSVDLHSHDQGSEISEVWMGTVVVEDSARGPTILQNGPAISATVDTWSIINSPADGSGVACEANGDDVSIDTVRYNYPDVSAPWHGIELGGGGDVTVGEVRCGPSPPTNAVVLRSGAGTGGSVVVDKIKGRDGMGRAVLSESSPELDTLIIRDVYQPGTWSTLGVDLTSGSEVTGDTFVLENVEADGGDSYDIASSNTPPTIRGGSASGTISVPAQTRFEDVTGVDHATVSGNAWSVNGVGVNAGDPTSTGPWNGNVVDGLTVRDTTNAVTYLGVSGSWV